jgi:hypothetical protein
VIHAHAAYLHDVTEVANLPATEFLAEGVRVLDVHAVARRKRVDVNAVELHGSVRLRADHALSRQTQRDGIADERLWQHQSKVPARRRLQRGPIEVVSMFV